MKSVLRIPCITKPNRKGRITLEFQILVVGICGGV